MSVVACTCGYVMKEQPHLAQYRCVKCGRTKSAVDTAIKRMFEKEMRRPTLLDSILLDRKPDDFPDSMRTVSKHAEGTAIDMRGTPLTAEIIEDAAKRMVEDYGRPSPFDEFTAVATAHTEELDRIGDMLGIPRRPGQPDAELREELRKRLALTSEEDRPFFRELEQDDGLIARIQAKLRERWGGNNG